MAAVARTLVRMGPAAEFRVHRVDAEFDTDLDGALPVPDGSLPLVFIVRGPPIHRQDRGNADIGIGKRFLECLGAGRKHAGRLEPLEKIGPGAELNPLVSEFSHFRGQFFE